MKKLFIILSLSFFLQAEASIDLDSIMKVLKVVESNNKEKIIGDQGRAYGILQIHKICVVEVNRHYGTSYTHKDCLDETCSEEIFELCMNIGIKMYKSKHNRMPTEKELVRMWNGGIYTGHKKPSTLPYYKKYKRIKKLLYKKP